MGWSTRKIEVRDVLVVSAIFALLGAVLSWLVFAWTGDPAKGFPFGGLSDWAAAVGTWVIGYGAWKYAREAHEQRMREYFETELRRLRVSFMQVWAMRERAVVARGAVKQMAMIDLESADGGITDARSACRVGSAVLSEIVWRPEDLFLLSEQVLRTHSLVALGITQMKELFGQGNALFDGKKIDKQSGQAFAAHLIDISEELREDFDSLVDQLTDTLKGIRRDANRAIRKRNEMFG